MSIFGRLVSWLLNDIIVHTLANNRRFQRLALKIDSTITNSKKIMEEKYVSNVAGTIKDKKETLQKFDVSKFINTFKEEVQKEMKNIKSSK